MTGEVARDKGLSEVAIVYAVVEEFPDQDRKVIMTICSKTSVINCASRIILVNLRTDQWSL